MRWLIAVPTALGSIAGSPARAQAHGIEGQVELQLPLGLYLAGAAVTVVASFFLFGFFLGTQHGSAGYPHFDLLRIKWLRALMTSGPLLALIRCIAVGLFVLTIIAGLIGDQAASTNLAPVLVWVIWWVGLGTFSSLVGNLWALINPWKTLFDWADRLMRRSGGSGLAIDEPYPATWGMWPALLFYVSFVCIELVFSEGLTPRDLALLVLGYSVVTWFGMVWFGPHTWLRGGEAFSVLFAFLARFAPTEVRVTDQAVCAECDAGCLPARGVGAEPSKARSGGGVIPDQAATRSDFALCVDCFEEAPERARQLNLRPWAAGLLRWLPWSQLGTSGLLFLLMVLASVTFDGLSATAYWLQVQTALFPYLGFAPAYEFAIVHILGLLATLALFYGLYLGTCALVRLFGARGVRLSTMAASFIFSLLPIALAYQISHYYTLLLVEGQLIIRLISDPFGWGWNLFGTAGYRVNEAVVSIGFVWYSQVVLIVIGHVLAVYVAHVVALRLLGNRLQAVRSQYPMLALMVVYTISSLWIISQPIVRESAANEAAPIPTVGVHA